MLENQFLQFSLGMPTDTCGLALPYNNGVAIKAILENSISSFDVVDAEGNEIVLPKVLTSRDYVSFVAKDLSEGQCFRFRYGTTNETLIKTNGWALTQHTEGDGIVFSETETGFRFDTGSSAKLGSRYVEVEIGGAVVAKNNIGESVSVKWRGNQYVRILLIREFNTTRTVEENLRLRITSSKYDANIEYRMSFSLKASISSLHTLIDMEDVQFVKSGDMYSNLLKVTSDTLALVEYKCNEDQFGFPFVGRGPVSVLLPIKVWKPQSLQDDQIYTKSNGDVVTLYSEITKEYECETDYIPEDWHDKLVVALACDEVRIDGKLLTKSDKYQIGWDESDETACGTKLAKGTFKMKENIVKRNSNY